MKYSLSGILHGYKIVSSEVEAKTLKEAKKLFRLKFKGVKSVIR